MKDLAKRLAQRSNLSNISSTSERCFAIDHRTWKTGLPVRSAVLKPCAGRLVVGWVTTSEYPLLIVLFFLPPCAIEFFCFKYQRCVGWDMLRDLGSWR